MRSDSDSAAVQVHREDGWQDYFVGSARPGSCHSIVDVSKRVALHYRLDEVSQLISQGQPASVPSYLWQKLVKRAQSR